jgi:hypothetical protein
MKLPSQRLKALKVERDIGTAKAMPGYESRFFSNIHTSTARTKSASMP